MISYLLRSGGSWLFLASHPTPVTKRRKGKETTRKGAPQSGRVGDCDEPVTVVCSRYEKRKGRPSSLIRTCQEPGTRCPTMEISRGSESKGVRLREQEVSPRANVVVVMVE